MDETKKTLNDVQVVAELASKAMLLQQTLNQEAEDRIPFLLTQEGIRLTTVEALLPQPTRRQGNIAVGDVKSFIALVKREMNPETTVIFANVPNGAPGEITAVIDFHNQEGAAAWSEYRVTLKLTYTAEWMEWRKVLNTAIRQIDMAEFLEERYADVMDTPAGAKGVTMLEVAKSLEARKGVAFRSANRLDNGDVSLMFEETTTARAGQKGEIEIPKEFTLYVPVYEGFAPTAIRILFRYRIAEGVLQFVCKPVNLERYLIAVREAIIADIAQQTGLPMFLGDAGTVPARPKIG